MDVSCSCGEAHDVDDAKVARFLSVVDTLDGDLKVGTPDGMWSVPAVYVLCHGSKGIAEAAQRYGFGRIREAAT